MLRRDPCASAQSRIIEQAGTMMAQVAQ